MLERLFTSKTRVRVLELLLFSDVPLHIREIARRVGITATYVGKELHNLEVLNLVRKSKKGNLYLYEINRSSPIYEELKSIFLKTESLGDYLKEELKDKNIRYVLIYGSFAKGEEKETSDIDLLMIGEVEEKELIPVISKMEERIKREISYVLWKEEEFLKRAREGHHLLKDIIGNPVIGVIGDMDGFRRTVEEGPDRKD
jgi:predicted nucleotidyltransferase